jgi:hypothetical protein
MSQPSEQFLAFQKRVSGTNINSETLLATDYLNHLNEPLMLLEMLPDMPDLVSELEIWRPKTYVEHFQASSFTDKNLAIEAYSWVPEEYLLAFEHTVKLANLCVSETIAAVRGPIENEQEAEIRAVVTNGLTALNHLVNRANAIIHGQEYVLEQSQIDEIMGDFGNSDDPSESSAHNYPPKGSLAN